MAASPSDEYHLLFHRQGIVLPAALNISFIFSEGCRNILPVSTIHPTHLLDFIEKKLVRFTRNELQRLTAEIQILS